MNLFGKSISVTIVLIMLISVLPVNAAERGTVEEGSITEHTPQSRILEEKEIPESGGTNLVMDHAWSGSGGCRCCRIGRGQQ